MVLLFWDARVEHARPRPHNTTALTLTVIVSCTEFLHVLIVPLTPFTPLWQGSELFRRLVWEVIRTMLFIVKVSSRGESSRHGENCSTVSSKLALLDIVEAKHRPTQEVTWTKRTKRIFEKRPEDINFYFRKEWCTRPDKVTLEGASTVIISSWEITGTAKKIYLRWSLCTLYLQACKVRVTVGDSGLCCCNLCCLSSDN